VKWHDLSPEQVDDMIDVALTMRAAGLFSPQDEEMLAALLRERPDVPDVSGGIPDPAE
jgi:hypothetical protein